MKIFSVVAALSALACLRDREIRYLLGPVLTLAVGPFFFATDLFGFMAGRGLVEILAFAIGFLVAQGYGLMLLFKERRATGK